MFLGDPKQVLHTINAISVHEFKIACDSSKRCSVIHDKHCKSDYNAYIGSKDWNNFKFQKKITKTKIAFIKNKRYRAIEPPRKYSKLSEPSIKKILFCIVIIVQPVSFKN